jgi:hypothetical protein
MTIEYNVGGLIVIFLLVIVLVMQIQLSTLSKKLEETEGKISKKIDELLKQKTNPK